MNVRKNNTGKKLFINSIDPLPKWNIPVIANLKEENHSPFDSQQELGPEYDRLETITAIQMAIESDGHKTTFIPADANLPFALHSLRPDICFNYAEGLGGEAREAQVPALLELFGIPYTGSRVLANAISLDKTLTKRVWREAGLPTAAFQEFHSTHEILREDLNYPLFVKPAHEGSGMGIDPNAVVHTEIELRDRIEYVLKVYRQPALVETYLPGREFSVGILGFPNARILSRRPELYRPDGFHTFPILEVDTYQGCTPGIYGQEAKSKNFLEKGCPSIICPANISPALSETMQRLALQAHQAIGALDFSRIDIRLDIQGEPVLMEINTIPGLAPGQSDLCSMAGAEGLGYPDLILEILYLAASRFGLIPPS